MLVCAVVVSTAGLSVRVLLSHLSVVIQNSFNTAILAIGLPSLLPTRPHDFNTSFIPPPLTHSILLLLLELPFPSRWHQFCAICTSHTPSNLTHLFKYAPLFYPETQFDIFFTESKILPSDVLRINPHRRL